MRISMSAGIAKGSKEDEVQDHRLVGLRRTAVVNPGAEQGERHTKASPWTGGWNSVELAGARSLV